MKKTHTALISGVLLLTACGDNATTPTPTADGGVVRADGGGFGTLTPTGPRVGGNRTGMITVGGAMGVGYDLDGDGDAEEVDLDGDGISDGEDIDGDGQITIWRNLEINGDVDSPALRDSELPATPAAVENRFAATAPLPGETPTGPALRASGGVNLVGGIIPTGRPEPGVLAARNQGSLGTCGTFSAAGAVALLRYGAERAAAPSLDVNTLWSAPIYAFNYNSRFEGTECTGTSIVGNFNRYMMFGAPSEAELPYPASPPANDTMAIFCTAPATDAAATSAHREANRLGGHVAIGGTGAAWRAEVKRQIDMGRPVVFGTKLPLGFQEWRSTAMTAAGTPTDVTQTFRGNGQCTGAHCGGHAMVITAYDDARNAYRVLNSWAGDWGDNGYLWWDYASLEGLTPHASAPILLPAGSAPLGPPNAAAITVSLAPMTAPAFARLPPRANGAVYWGLIARVRFSEPVVITSVLSDVDGSQFTSGLNQAMLEGDVQGLVIGSEAAGYAPMSNVGQMATLTITATSRDGMTITRALPTFAVPAPTM